MALFFSHQDMRKAKRPPAKRQWATCQSPAVPAATALEAAKVAISQVGCNRVGASRNRVAVALGTLALLGLGCPRTPQQTSPVAEPLLFEEVTEAAGVHYLWKPEGTPPYSILQTIGNGCAFLDFNNDGNLDILLIGPKPALFTGDGKGKFTDSTALLGGVNGHFLGVAVGDYDSDGFPDLYLSGYHEGRLLHNDGGKGFTDVTAASGLKPQPWGTSCAFVETVAGSGKLDLVVANYAKFGPEPGIPQLCDGKDVEGKPLQTSCGPRHYEPLKATLFRNLGSGKFAPSALESTTGRGLGVATCDFDQSGHQSIAFANDEIAGDLLHNRGGGTLKNIGQESGVAYDRDSNVHGGMGIAWGDYDNDLKLDLVVATFQNEPKSLYHNEGNRFFVDSSMTCGLGMPTRPNVAFGVAFFDFDNDGWLDLAFANGHVQDNIGQIDKSTTFRQAAQLFRNQGATGFSEVSAQAGSGFKKPLVGRGLATGDYDNDGRIDLLIVDSNGAPLLLHNTAKAGHWLGLELTGKGGHEALGAQVTVEVGGKKLLRHYHRDGSYLSSSDPRVHFGLGTATKVDSVTIHWPSGKTQVLKDLPVDRYSKVQEP